ncbi:MAG TPA: BadF/BadG/BcrA/BcrD ATPase family protein [Anaerolineales bacterium]|nr:BadF/BadG/BcrA/BcrD ATPase family protein [Anaerolineales bacterium]
MKYFLGIDVGSSKTHALIVDETGQCAGFGKSGGGNHQSVGYEGLAGVLQASFQAAQAMAAIDMHQIVGAGFGVAGYDFPSDREPHLQVIASLGLTCPVEVVNDGMNGLLAGATRGIGVNVTAGSSNNCRGRNQHGREGRIVGNGILFGEFGGAYEIAARGLQMVNYAWIKRSRPTLLTQVYLEATGARDEIELMEGLSNHRYHLSPHLAVKVIETARAGDAAARDVLHWAGEELGWLAVAVARQLDMEGMEVEIVQSGSIFKAGDLITTPMRELVLKHCPKAELLPLEGPPVVGAVILGMEQTNFDGYAVRDNMVRTAKGLAF